MDEAKRQFRRHRPPRFPPVPGYAEEPLRRWIKAALQGEGRHDRQDLHLHLKSRPLRPEPGEGAKAFAERLPSIRLLDAIDAILEIGGPWPGAFAPIGTARALRADLDALLRERTWGAVWVDDGGRGPFALQPPPRLNSEWKRTGRGPGRTCSSWAQSSSKMARCWPARRRLSLPVSRRLSRKWCRSPSGQRQRSAKQRPAGSISARSSISEWRQSSARLRLSSRFVINQPRRALTALFFGG